MSVVLTVSPGTNNVPCVLLQVDFAIDVHTTLHQGEDVPQGKEVAMTTTN